MHPAGTRLKVSSPRGRRSGDCGEAGDLSRTVNRIGVTSGATRQRAEILRRAGIVTPQGRVSFSRGIAAPAHDSSCQVDIEARSYRAAQGLHHNDTGLAVPIKGAGAGGEI